MTSGPNTVCQRVVLLLVMAVACDLLSPSTAAADATQPGSTSDRTVDDAYARLLRLGLIDARPAEPEASEVTTATEVIEAEPVSPSKRDAGQTAMRISTQISTKRGSSTVREFTDSPAANSTDDSAVRLVHSYGVLERLGLLNAPPTEQRTFSPPLKRPRQVDRVVVDKSERKLVLLKDGKALREYRVSLGGEPDGPKIKEGDLRTPEGVYTLDWRNPSSRFYKSMHISYPNEQDLERAESLGVEPGGMIMIHGEHPMQALRNIYRRVARDWTEGCIAMLNEHIDELWTLVDDGTPIEIRP